MGKILIVDDLPFNIKILSNLLKKYEILVADNGSKAIQFAKTHLPDLILMDIIMPDMDGFSACSVLKNFAETATIPIIFITARNKAEDIIKGFEVGGVDYITKPFNSAELYARIKTHLELKRTREELNNYVLRLEELNKQLSHKNVQLNEVMKNLHVNAMTDPLTGLANRRHMTEKIHEEINRFSRTERLFSLILADVDYFKKINDDFGHECGDYILKSVAETMRANIRKHDSLARWGGEEFLFLLPETNLEGSLIIAEKLRKIVEESKIFYEDNKINITMTFGVASFSQSNGMDGSIKKADIALYKGKERGRNCVVAS
jgi:diguanylate cyclase (GGDEF)-like protein